MALTSLLVCADSRTVQAVSRILTEMGILVENCGDPSTAISQFSQQYFDTVLVDYEDPEAASAFIAHLRQRSDNKDVTVIAILRAGTNAREIFSKGANLVLYKPVADGRIEKKLAVPKAPISERRLTPRIPVNADASIAYASTENEVTRVVDLSVDGMAIYSAKQLPRNCKVYFQFSLPGEDATIRLSCEVIWQNGTGNVGMRFVDVPKTSRRVLDYWIKNKVGTQLQVVSAAAPSEESANDLRQRLAVRLGLTGATSSDRRQGARHPCSLGAEVSRSGSTVQQRCMVSDVSMGGCYVQTSEPLPVGTSIELVVRTKELKLRLFGKVQSVHRGLGMGVHFAPEKVPPQLQTLIAEAQKQHVTV